MSMQRNVLCSNFSGALRKTILFLREGHFGHSRLSKVITVGAKWKRVCDFLLVCNSNLGPIFHRFGDFAGFLCFWPHPYSTLILEVFPLQQITHVGVNVSRDLKLFGREIIFEEFQPMWSRYLNATDRQTDRQTDDMQSHNCTLGSIAW